MRDKEGIYFLGRREAAPDTFRRLNAKLVESFQDASLLSNPLRNWDVFFNHLAENVKKRFILCFDEFPYLTERFPEFPSMLQDHWDSRLQHLPLCLILCGSSVAMMHRDVLDASSPLYGRRTHQWRIRTVSPRAMKLFLPGYSPQQIVETYAAIDAIPGYLTKFDAQKTILENIREHILSKGGFFYEEVDFLLREELRDTSNYMSIISAVAGGCTRLKEITEATSLDKSLVSKYLHTLGGLDIITKQFPFSASPKEKTRPNQGHYSLSDQFFTFWFKFVYPHKESLEIGDYAPAEKLLKRDFNTHVGHAFEGLTHSFLLKNTKKLPFTPTHTGKWWGGNAEIDWVAANPQEKSIVFLECKWRQDVKPGKTLGKLKKKVEENNLLKKGWKHWYAVLGKTFTQPVPTDENTLIFTLNDFIE